jgi:hypothetical protein
MKTSTKIKIETAVLTAIALTIALFFTSCTSLKETYHTENGITIHTIGKGAHSQAYLIVKQQKPTSHE